MNVDVGDLIEEVEPTSDTPRPSPPEVIDLTNDTDEDSPSGPTSTGAPSGSTGASQQSGSSKRSWHLPVLATEEVAEVMSQYVFNTNNAVGVQTDRRWAGKHKPDTLMLSMEERHAEQVDADRVLPDVMAEAGHPIFVSQL